MLDLFAFIIATALQIAAIIYCLFIFKNIKHEERKAAHASREAEERLEAFDQFLSDNFSEASRGYHN
jgi:hypothetical protein